MTKEEQDFLRDLRRVMKRYGVELIHGPHEGEEFEFYFRDLHGEFICLRVDQGLSNELKEWT